MIDLIRSAIPLCALLALSFCGLQAQEISKNLLSKTWHLDKYADDEDYHPLPEEELGDYLHLREDMTFAARLEGEVESGTWMLNTNGAYLELKYANGEKDKLYIIYSTNRTLVLIYDIDEYREWELHYVSCS